MPVNSSASDSQEETFQNNFSNKVKGGLELFAKGETEAGFTPYCPSCQKKSNSLSPVPVDIRRNCGLVSSSEEVKEGRLMKNKNVSRVYGYLKRI